MYYARTDSTSSESFYHTSLITTLTSKNLEEAFRFLAEAIAKTAEDE